MSSPRILIPLAQQNSHTPPVYSINQTYIDAVVRAGGIPLCITRPEKEDVAALLSSVDGILLIGGHDIDPAHYGEERKEYTCNIDADRDRLELMLVHVAKERRLPILGICRGMQVMNVAGGGSLYQDVYSEMPHAIVHDYHNDTQSKPLARNTIAHDIMIVEGTLLSEIARSPLIAVNSLHHQGIKTLGKGLSPSGRASDGLIEAIEIVDHPFGLGIEWHPEELGDATSQKIFAAFVVATKNKRQ
jgi:putative glutamine amidotransferase